MRALALSGGKDSMACLFLELERLDCAIYVDTGFSYPETQSMIDLASSMLKVYTVKTPRADQNRDWGIPADVVPVNWTLLGQSVTGVKPVKVQSYLQCCNENMSEPLFAYAKQLGVTELVAGQRNDEGHKGSLRDGQVLDGIKRVHPIETWTSEQVLAFLANKMVVPEHFYIKHSSLDCYDCTAYGQESRDRIDWTKSKHPVFFAAYDKRRVLLDSALREALRSN